MTCRSRPQQVGRSWHRFLLLPSPACAAVVDDLGPIWIYSKSLLIGGLGSTSDVYERGDFKKKNTRIPRIKKIRDQRCEIASKRFYISIPGRGIKIASKSRPLQIFIPLYCR